MVEWLSYCICICWNSVQSSTSDIKKSLKMSRLRHFCPTQACTIPALLHLLPACHHYQLAAAGGWRQQQPGSEGEGTQIFGSFSKTFKTWNPGFWFYSWYYFCDVTESWQPFFMCMTLWSFFGIHGSTYLLRITWKGLAALLALGFALRTRCACGLGLTKKRTDNLTWILQQRNQFWVPECHEMHFFCLQRIGPRPAKLKKNAMVESVMLE